jgi:putative transposase
MQLTYRYRLYPSRKQNEKLFATLDLCRRLYNHFLEKLNQKENGKTPRRYELQATLPRLKQEHPELKQVHSKVLQMVLHQLYSNLRTLVELKKNDRRAGKLRFKGEGWFKSFPYNQSGFKIIEGHGKRRGLRLSKVGAIPIVLHRELDGDVKQVHIKRERSGKWFACFSVEVDGAPRAEKLSKPVGIDLGITHYIADTNGNFVKHPHNIVKSEWRLKREQRGLSRKEKSSKNRAKQCIRLALVHERIKNQRLDFLHKLSRHYIKIRLHRG